jgi:hypothetical protein
LAGSIEVPEAGLFKSAAGYTRRTAAVGCGVGVEVHVTRVPVMVARGVRVGVRVGVAVGAHVAVSVPGMSGVLVGVRVGVFDGVGVKVAVRSPMSTACVGTGDAVTR